MIAIAFQSTFCYFFYFLKIIFDISTSKDPKILKKLSKKNLNFQKMPLETQS